MKKMSRTHDLDGVMATPPVFTNRRKTAVRRAVIFCNTNALRTAFLKTSVPGHLRSGQVALPPNAFLIKPWLQFLGDQYGTFRMGSVPGVEAVLNFPEWASLSIPLLAVTIKINKQ